MGSPFAPCAFRVRLGRCLEHRGGIEMREQARREAMRKSAHPESDGRRRKHDGGAEAQKRSAPHGGE